MRSRARFTPGKIRSITNVVRDALRRSAALRGVVKTWQLAEGSDTDDILPGRWAVELFPALRLDIEGIGGGYKNQANQQSTIILVVTLGVPGTDPRDASDFWEMVVAVLFPCDGSLLDLFAPLGVFGYAIDGPAVSQTVVYPDGAGQVVTGRVSFPFEYRAKP